MAEQASLMSRRNILIGLAGGAAVAGGITVQQTGSVGKFAERLRPDDLILGRQGVGLALANKEDWALKVGSFFTTQTGNVLKLASVQSFPERGARRPRGLRPGAFVARFDIVSGGPMQAAQLVTVNHKEGGMFDMFLTGGNPARPLRMLAVFN